MKGKAVKYSVAVAVLASMMQTTPTFASPVNSPVTKGQIAQTQGKINTLETKVQQLDNQISVGMDKSQKLSAAIKAQLAQIDKTKAAIEKAKNDLEAHKEVYSDRLRSMQSEGQSPIITYAELLLSSNNLSEFLTRSSAISQILQSDSDLMTALNQKEQALKLAEQQLHTELDNLKKSQDELAAQQSQIQAAKQQVEQELSSSKNILQQQQTQLAKQQAIIRQQAAQRLAQIQAQQRAQQQAQQAAQSQSVQQQSSASSAPVSAPYTGGSNLSNSQMASTVIATAEQYLGVPYVWGGTSPSGFDCSGLMQYVFHSVGINLPRIASDQQNAGIRISPSNVQPGDLVFMGDPAYHVGMYIGNGQWIEAPQTGDVVKIVPYYPSMFSSAARVLP